jgi:hypothetical protein
MSYSNPNEGYVSTGDWLTNFWNDITGVTTTNIQAQAAADAAAIEAQGATDAAATQAASAAAAIAEQQRQFDAMQALMAPWVSQGTEALGQLGKYESAGTDALSMQRALMGLDGPDAQRAAINGISNNPEMAAMIGQGENAMLQQGAATGGLRGGNIQGALAQFRPQMLSQLINNQYSKLGGLIDMGQGITMNRAALGQASSAGMAAGNMQQASSIGNLLMQQGNALAGGQIGAASANAGGTMAAGQYNAQGISNAYAPIRTAAQLAAMYALGAF